MEEAETTKLGADVYHFCSGPGGNDTHHCLVCTHVCTSPTARITDNMFCCTAWFQSRMLLVHLDIPQARSTPCALLALPVLPPYGDLLKMRLWCLMLWIERFAWM